MREVQEEGKVWKKVKKKKEKKKESLF